MTSKTTALLLGLSVAALAAPSTGSGQSLFEDNFDGGTSGGSWLSATAVSVPTTDSYADFAFDYSLIGIPAAPHSLGTTVGMGFVVNREGASGGVLPGISASPIGMHFTGDFRIEFDAWLNFVGPFPAGGNGSTQMASFGWGANGTSVQYAASNRSIIFAASGDGGTAQDYRVYRVGGGAPLAPDANPGVYAAGDVGGGAAADSRQASNSYYASLGSKTAPLAQQILYPNQSGTTAAGTFGMAWHDVIVDKVGDTLTWTVDGLRIAAVPLNGAVPGGDNIFFGMFDINTNASTDPNNFLNTAIYDNVVVTQIPEPAAGMLLLGVGGLVALRRRQRGTLDR